jgi:hypothetical protein
MNDHQRSSKTVTLEDLLRIKRAERPPAEFWASFEKSLRAKQLAAIVEKRPWWYSWRPVFRWSVPAGAVAAVAVTVLSLRSGGGLAEAPQTGREIATAIPVQSEPASLERVALQPETAVAPASSFDAPRHAAEPVVVAAAESVQSSAPAAVVPAERTPSGALASVSEQISGVAVASVQTSPVSVTTAATESEMRPGADFGAFFERAVAHLDEGFRTMKQPSSEPLAQLTTPKDARRARLLAFGSSVDANSPMYSNASNVLRSRERITSHLNDEALYDSIRRLGVKGNGVSIQF